MVQIKLQGVESLLEVGDDVLVIFETDAEADETRCNAGGLELILGIGRVGHGGGMLNESFGIAEGDGDGHELEGVDELCTGRTAALDLKRYHAAKVLHLLCSDIVADMRHKAGVVDLLDCGVSIEELGDLFCVEAVLLHADLKGLETTENEKCAERIHNGAGHILETEHANLANELGRADDKARYDIAVTVEVLGGGVHNDIGAELQRVLKIGGGKGVVADDLDVLAICMSDLGNGCNVGYLEVGVCGSFEVDAAGVGLEVSLDGLKVGGVDEIDLNAVAGHAVVEQSKGAAVQSAVGDDVLACACYCPQSRGDSAHAGSGGNACLAALKSGYLAFEHGCGGVA